MDFLKKRAGEFIDGARIFFERREFAISAFSVEQAVQLRLKYFLWSRVGDFPKTHSLKTLFEDCAKLCPRLAEVYDGAVTLASSIEDAYVMSRYFDKEYGETEIRKMIEFYDHLIEELEKCD